ncbi:MAG: hypothetical protein RIR18_1536 [Pseudomonadota bacterium]|jgi:hypothetical protein
MTFHPAAYIVCTLGLMLGLQYLSSLWLTFLVMALLPLLGAQARQYWATLVFRNRWLLIMLFIIFAYGLPGEGIGGFEWTPSALGMTEAALHLLRLITLLGILAGLLTRCSHQDLVLGLWTLLNPLRRVGFPVERSIVRLALVLEALGEIKKTKPSLSRTSFKEWQSELANSLSAKDYVSDFDKNNTIQIQPRNWSIQDVALMLVGQVPLFVHCLIP